MCKIVSIARLSRGKRGITKGTIDIYRKINIRCAYVLNRQQPCGPPGIITNRLIMRDLFVNINLLVTKNTSGLVF